MYTPRLAGIALASSLVLLALTGLPAAAQNAGSTSVIITDSGFRPTTVSIPLNGTVTWTNNGTNVHTATSIGSVQTPFDSGGLETGQTFSFTFTVPGSYQFTSASDCLSGSTPSGFNCVPASVNVGVSAAAPPSPQPSAAAPAAAAGIPAELASCTYVTDATHADPFCNTNQVATITLPASKNGTGASATYTFDYPGDNSNILLTAKVDGLSNMALASSVGVNVFDPANPTTPIETNTLADNQLPGDPTTFRVVYSSGDTGPVTMQLFNWSPTPITLTVSHSGLIRTDGSVNPISLSLASKTAVA